MYSLTKLETNVDKGSIDKIGKPFTKGSPMYPLRKVETLLNKESIDKIYNTSCQSLSHVPIDEFRNPS